MLMAFDVETTGLYKHGLPPEDPSQPYIVQIACLLLDEHGTERAAFHSIVRPEICIPGQAAAIHKIDDALALKCGVDNAEAVAIWHLFASIAKTVIAHNLRFDTAVIKTAWIRAKRQECIKETHNHRAYQCTMDLAAPVINLPPTQKMIAAKINKPKSPRLEECIKHFFNEDFADAHDAMADTRACARIFLHLTRGGKL